MRLKGIGSVIVVAAIGAAVAGAPAAVVREYGERVYPALQAAVTPLSNRGSAPAVRSMLVVSSWSACGPPLSGAAGLAYAIGLADRCGCSGAALVVGAAACISGSSCCGATTTARPGVEAALASFHADRATPALVAEARGARGVAVQSSCMRDAHRAGFPAADDGARPAARLAARGRTAAGPHAAHRGVETEAAAGARRTCAPSASAACWRRGFSRRISIRTSRGPERPYVLAHEWAHLSGFAPEEDASFVGLLAALGADRRRRYSAWLFLASEAAMQLHAGDAAIVLADLDRGPAGRSPGDRPRGCSCACRGWIARAGCAYDRAIKSQGADEGVAGYGRVIDLVLGSACWRRRGWRRDARDGNRRRAARSGGRRRSRRGHAPRRPGRVSDRDGVRPRRQRARCGRRRACLRGEGPAGRRTP